MTTRQLFPGRGCERLGQGTPQAAAALAPSGSAPPPLEPLNQRETYASLRSHESPVLLAWRSAPFSPAASHTGDGLSKKFAGGVSVPGHGTWVPTQPPLLHLASAAHVRQL